MVCCVSHLVIDHILLSQSITSSTIFRCLSRAANLSCPAQIMKSIIDDMGNISKLITDLLHESKR